MGNAVLLYLGGALPKEGSDFHRNQRKHPLATSVTNFRFSLSWEGCLYGKIARRQQRNLGIGDITGLHASPGENASRG